MHKFSWRFPDSSGSPAAALSDSWRLVESGIPVLLPTRFTPAGPDTIWRQRLTECGDLLSQGQRFAAWQRLQSGLRQSDPEQSPDEWLMMAVCALAIEDHSTAARYAQVAHAKMTGERHLCHWNLLRDTYADWLTVTATIEISQGRLETAAEMLQCAFDSHKAVGDLEQMAVDLMLTADCCRMQGDYSSVRQSLTKASSILREECDADRHLRLPGLLRNLSHRLSEGEVAYAEPFASDA